MNRLLVLLSALCLALTCVEAASSTTSFCKCICFNNSTIIALNPPKASTAASPHPLPLSLRTPASSSSAGDHLTCSSCNRAFCISYKLPICANAKEEDVFAQCFQRDSLKDEAVVFIFIFATAGLLGWALLKPWVVRWTGWFGGVENKGVGSAGRSGDGARYVPLGGGDDGRGLGEGRDSGGMEGERGG